MKMFRMPLLIWATLVAAAPTTARGDEIRVDGDETSISVIAQNFNTGVPIIFMREDGMSSGLSYQFFNNTDKWTFFEVQELAVRANTGNGGQVDIHGRLSGLLLSSDDQNQRYLADANDNGFNSAHIWYQDSLADGDRLMQLQHTGGGDLLIGGELTTMQGFDLAESFFELEAVEPGELVAVDARNPKAVRRTTGAYQATAIGVASTQPGLLLGGSAFSLEGLRETWGDEIGDDFEQRRPALEIEILAEEPELQAAEARLRSQADWAVYFRQTEVESAALSTQQENHPSLPGRSGASSSKGLDRAYDVALRDHQQLMFDTAVQRYFDQQFSAVALAGRVPVKATASFGAIRPGDYLTSSPVPGVAMKATASGPVIGTALQSLEAGSGSIEVLVHRGWFGGEGRQLAQHRPNREPAIQAAKDQEIAELKYRLAALEERLEALGLGDQVLAANTRTP